MFKLCFSEAALADLDEIHGYIAGELMNPDAADNTVSGILDAVDRLAEFPLSGTPLNALIDIESDYRFVISGHYLAFYHLADGAVLVDRVLYERRDCVKALFL